MVLVALYYTHDVISFQNFQLASSFKACSHIKSLFGQQKMVTQFPSLITQIFTSVCLHCPISITQYFSHYSWTPQLLLCQTTSILLPAYHFHPHQYFSFSHFPFPFSPVSLPKQKPKPRKMLQPPSPRQYHHHR